CQQHTYPWTF
nr:immunoglobulin light chain junction region [Macaca mulatta]